MSLCPPRVRDYIYANKNVFIGILTTIFVCSCILICMGFEQITSQIKINLFISVSIFKFQCRIKALIISFLDKCVPEEQ